MTAVRALDAGQRGSLLAIAEQAIGRALIASQLPPFDASEIDDPELLRPGAAFVTLLRGDQLLGCVGSLHAGEPLAAAVHRAALQAAFADPRLPAVTAADFDVMTLKISVLSELEPMSVSSFGELASAIRPGVDGIVLDAPRHRATLLPSVWQQCPDVETFLGALWAKAGLPLGTWPRAMRVERYTTEEFAGYGPRLNCEPRAARDEESRPPEPHAPA